MKPICSLLAAGVVLCVSAPVVHADEAPEPPAPPPAEVVDSVNAFAFDLYGRLAAESDDNLFLSPASISTALAMTYAGARQTTAEQMAAVLHLPERDVHEGFGAMVDYLNALGEQEDFDLTMANALWGQHDYAFRPEFTELLGANYRAGLRPVDFRRDAEAARLRINAWVEEQTNEKIQDLIPPRVLSAYTRLVLTNAIYFHGYWQEQFDPDNTRPRPFTTAAGEEVETPMMFQEAEFRYAEFGYGEDATVQCLEMGYAGGDMAMTILLPRRKDGLPGLEKGLDAAALRQWTGRLRSRKVRVYLPKFSMTTQFQLKPVLAAMGMPEAFTANRADFSGMDGTRELFIHEVIHKAFVDVNETGTEAAAATGIVVGVTAVPPPPPVFRADRPFLFLIRDTRSGAVLFAGRVNDPSP